MSDLSTSHGSLIRDASTKCNEQPVLGAAWAVLETQTIHRGLREPQDCLYSGWELKFPDELRMKVGSGVRKAVQAMGPAAHGYQAVFSTHSSQEGRPEEGW